MDSAVQVIYLDVLLVPIGVNFLFDWLLLWATAEVTQTRTTRLRLMAGAALGSFHYALYLLSAYGVIGSYAIIRFPITVGLVSLAMLGSTFFAKMKVRRLLGLAGTFYVILCVSAGAGLAAGNLLANGGEPNQVVIQLAAIGALLVVAELGWGVVQRRIWRGLYLVPIEITFDERSVHIMALVDTGNQLTDPITRAPVIVVELGAVRSLFPEALQHDIAELSAGDFSGVTGLLSHSSWSSRIRLIPFTSLGAQNGLLVGFKPDRVRIMLPQIVNVPKRAIIGLAQHVLDRDGQYQALLHPSLLDSAHEELGAALGQTDSNPHAALIHSNKGGKTVVDTTP